MNEFNSKTNQRLDLGGLDQREEIRKAEAQQKPQQVGGTEATRRGFNSFSPEGHRLIDLEKLRDRDPAAFAFLVLNRIR